MSDTPTQAQSNDDTARAFSEQNADLVAYIQEYQQKSADDQFTIIQLRRSVARLEAKVSEMETQLASEK